MNENMNLGCYWHGVHHSIQEDSTEYWTWSKYSVSLYHSRSPKSFSKDVYMRPATYSEEMFSEMQKLDVSRYLSHLLIEIKCIYSWHVDWYVHWRATVLIKNVENKRH